MKRAFLIVLTAFVSLLASEHSHAGFYLRMQPGIGIGYANFEDLVEASGGSGAFSLHLGYAPVENFIVFGKFSSNSITNPTLTLAGSVNIATDNTQYTVNAFGAGVTYYLPVNFYLTGSIDIATSKLKMGDLELDSDPGIGMELSLGKEWYVSGKWGLGLALLTQFSKMESKEDDVTYDLGNVFIGLMFSATYN